jgi:lipopolysaccharide export system protein LptC
MVQVAARQSRFAGLARRNRIVGVLRWAVPGFGLVVLVALVVQIVLANMGSRFGIGQVSISPDAITIDAPDYAGIMGDGSTYRVWASSARAPLGQTDVLDLVDAGIVVTRTDGVTLEALAAEGKVDTTKNQVLVEDRADFTYSTGTTGILYDTVVDLDAQTLTSKGRTEVDYADGTTVRAEGLHYDAEALRWTFTRAVVTLPSTPGEDNP